MEKPTSQDSIVSVLNPLRAEVGDFYHHGSAASQLTSMPQIRSSQQDHIHSKMQINTTINLVARSPLNAVALSLQISQQKPSRHFLRSSHHHKSLRPITMLQANWTQELLEQSAHIPNRWLWWYFLSIRIWFPLSSACFWKLSCLPQRILEARMEWGLAETMDKVRVTRYPHIEFILYD